MPSVDEFKSKKPILTVLLNGSFGVGKTLQALSFPKCFVISADPAGLETIRQPKHAKSLANLVWYEELHNEDEQELKKVFDERATNDLNSIYGCLERAKQMASRGEIETLVIDGFTYIADMWWQKINEFETKKSATTGAIDTQAMYRNLGLGLQRFVASDLLTMATRNNCNVVVSCHLKRESEETVHGSDKFKNRAKKVSTQSDIAPLIEGGFRNKIEGLFGASIYLDRKIKDGKTLYEAICDVSVGMNTMVMGKNRFGLPARVDLTDKSLYGAIMGALRPAQTQPAAAKPAPAPSTAQQSASKPTPTTPQTGQVSASKPNVAAGPSSGPSQPVQPKPAASTAVAPTTASTGTK